MSRRDLCGRFLKGYLEIRAGGQSSISGTDNHNKSSRFVMISTTDFGK